MIVALARKLLIAFWRLVKTGEVPAGVTLRQRLEDRGSRSGTTQVGDSTLFRDRPPLTIRGGGEPRTAMASMPR
jgi:hypothetical protein